jgi:hypothetical protein
MPMESEGFVAKIIVRSNCNGITKVGLDHWAGPLAIDRDYGTISNCENASFS